MIEPTDIASHVEQYNSKQHDECLHQMGCSEQIVIGATWMVAFTSPDGVLCTSYRTGFVTKNEAEAFKDGWNSHRRNVSALLFKTIIKKKRKNQSLASKSS